MTVERLALLRTVTLCLDALQELLTFCILTVKYSFTLLDHLQEGRLMDPEAGTIALSSVDHIGEGLSRPECILAQASGDLWVCDDRSGVVRIAPDGTQEWIGNVGGVPNGIAMDRNGDIIVANIEDGLVQRLRRDGTHETMLDALDGRPLGAVNFVLFDSRWRLWVCVSTRTYPRREAIDDPRPDGYIILIEAGRARIVADGLWFTNEARMSPDESVLYVAETTKGRITAFDVAGDGSLSGRRVHGPDRLWSGALVDGVTVDSSGTLWITEITQNALVTLSGADSAPAIALADPEGRTMDFPTSTTFGGPDLKEVWVGSLRMDRLPHFRVQTPGLVPPHWNLG